MIMINASNIKVGGGLQVTASIANELSLKNLSKIIFVIPICLRGQIRENNVSLYHYVASYKLIERNKILNGLLKKYKVQSVLSIFGPVYWKPSGCFHLVGFALPWIVYSDLPIYKNLRLINRLKKYLYNQVRIRVIQYESDELWVETEDVKSRLLKLIKDKNIHVFNNAISDDFVNGNTPVFLPNKNDGLKYILFLSHWYEHKNISILSKLSITLRDKVRFIVTVESKVFELLDSESKKFFINVGVVSPKQASSLYDYCDVVIQPSLLECFSANYVEAMYSKKLMVVSDLPFAKGICQNGALYFDPYDEYDFNLTIDKAISLSCEDKNIILNNASKILSSFNNSTYRALSIYSILENEL